MSTTKFDNLVIASQRVAETSLSPGPPQGQDGQAGNTATRQNAEAHLPQPGQAPYVAPQEQQAQPHSGGTQKSAQASGTAPKKKPAAKRKRDDSQPKRPRGRPRKYPLPPDFHSTLSVSRPQAAPVRTDVTPTAALAASTAAASARLANGLPRPSAPRQNGPSQPGMSLYEAWSRSQGAGFLGSPSKQAALYALRSQQQHMQQQQHPQQQGQEPPAGQAQEYFEFPPHGFMALMQEYAPALAGAFQDGHLAAFGFPAPSTQPAAQGAASAEAVQNPLVIRNPQGPLPAFSQAEAATQDATPTQDTPVPQGAVPGLATRSPSRRKPQKSPGKPQQGALAGTASPARMQQALSQSAATSPPARVPASPAGRSRAQRKNAATPQRVVPGAAASAAAQLAPAQVAPAAAEAQQATAAAAHAAAEGVQGQASAPGTTAQQGSAEQENPSGVSKPDQRGHSHPSHSGLDDDPSPFGAEVPVESIDYPGLRPSKKAAKMKDLKKLSEEKPRLPEAAIHGIPAFHVSQSRTRPTRSSSVRNKEVSGAGSQMHASASALPGKAGQPQVTGPTEISEAATVSDHAQPEPTRDTSAARQSAEGGEAPASKRPSAAAGKQQARSEAAASPLTPGSALASRSAQSEPTAPVQPPTPASIAAFRAMLQAAAPPVQQQAPSSSSALAVRPTGAPVTALQQAAGGPQAAQAEHTEAIREATAAGQRAQAGSAGAAQQPAEATAASAAPAQAPPSAHSVPALAAAQPEPPQADASQPHTAGGMTAAQIAAGLQTPVETSAAAVLPVSQAAVAPLQQGAQEAVTAASTAPGQVAAAHERHALPNGTLRSQQASAAWGALKEQLNNILLSCLAEEAKRAQAAQEAIEVCRAAEEGLEHLNKQYGLQQSFHTTYAHVVDEVSEALQATSAANRRVQEVQERLNAVQEELKREVAAAEVARGRAMTVLRKQAALKEEMEVARGEVARILHQPQTDLEQLRETMSAQTEHAGNMRAAKEAAIQSLAQCRQDKDRLLALMNSDPPPTAEALAAAGIGCSAANLR